MKTFNCLCSNTLFFENSQCLNCQREVGWCPECDRAKGAALCGRITTMIPQEEDRYQCGNPACEAILVKCYNNAAYKVCNRYIKVESVTSDKHLCDYCRYNDTIPDLAVAGNQQRWYKLERAKRRLLYTLELLGVPFGNNVDGFDPPLSFDFKGDVLVKDSLWRTIGKGDAAGTAQGADRVMTGHADGKITINIKEADDVEREKLRIDLNEAQRTLVGHFHHEIGHYYWQAYVKGEWLDRFKELFGDHENPSYSEALNKYYQDGAPADWRNNYISAYATMHPWEDFAETFAAYLDMVSVLDTANHMTSLVDLDVKTSDFDTMLLQYGKIGVMLNEMNRTLGLLDYVPDVLTLPVAVKMKYIHELLQSISQKDVPTMAMSV